jgi:hypothetical protein
VYREESENMKDNKRHMSVSLTFKQREEDFIFKRQYDAETAVISNYLNGEAVTSEEYLKKL